MRQETIHRKDAEQLLCDGQPHRLRLWKLATGETLLYPEATCTSLHRRGGTANVRLHPSGEQRKLRLCTLFEIDHLRIYY